MRNGYGTALNHFNALEHKTRDGKMFIRNRINATNPNIRLTSIRVSSCNVNFVTDTKIHHVTLILTSDS